MKIEIAESLFYSWLRHVKSCQIVQTNWKLSKQWDLKEELKEKLETFMKELDGFFYGKYKYQIFKQNASLDQLLNQGECDALGIRLNAENQYECYAVDVAFHENGLKYDEKDVTVMKVVEKCVRTAFCLYGYLNTTNAEILFASPKIYPAVYEPLDRCIDDLNDFFRGKGLAFKFCLVANEDFNEKVIEPTLRAANNEADTTELFMRSYKLLTMFGDTEKKGGEIAVEIGNSIRSDEAKKLQRNTSVDYNEDAKRKLTTMGIAWFASYAYYNYCDKSHRLWEKAKTKQPRISAYNRGTQYMRIWLNEVIEKKDENLNKQENELGLKAEEIKMLVRKVLAKL